ncbi:MAG: hypothetical protein P9M08_02165 [Candidatus Erginobacter occultus]|nr:hypothetical protein [Candidatus Erginobacter occultus]
MKKMALLTGLALVILPALLPNLLFGQGYGTSRTEVRDGDPRLELISFNLQTVIAQGQLVSGSLFFKATSPLEENLKVFFHLVRPGQTDTVLNADFSPRNSTRRWDVNQVAEAGPFDLAIPFNLEPGEYDIRAGLLRIVREEDVVLYVREPYLNPEIENFIIGRLTVAATERADPDGPSEFDLIAFDSEAEIVFWETLGARVEFMGYQDEAEETVSAVRVTILPGMAEYPGVILQNFFNLRPDRADWSTYDTLRLNLHLPPDNRGGSLRFQITDRSGRVYEKTFPLASGRTERLEISTVDLSGSINVSAISRIKFFLVNPSTPFTFYISGLRLISRGQPTGKPAVTFVRMEAPEEVERGRPFLIRFIFTIDQPIFQRHKLFTHVYRVNDMAGNIGSDVGLTPPIRNWRLNEEAAVDSGPLMISADAPPGTYVVRAGLYVVADSPGSGYVKIDDWMAYDGRQEVINVMQAEGPVDYIKQPYTNLEIQNWEVGTITVE